ncbi:hypothetical protein GH714_027048 [Hevea brasiliensis]|uniref:Uncharacterized protein n=1 Tax=Hevea brasiliensis TaxID=3981 RepID=A0A6A6MID2_HEVBR|nr:hypothetical protein GH714_027048 [Hevea brasiliensis]
MRAGVESAALGKKDKSQIEVVGDGVDAVKLTSLLRKRLARGAWMPCLFPNNGVYAELVSVSAVKEKKTIRIKRKQRERTSGSGEVQLSPFEYLIMGYNHFSDLDDTLYSLSSGLSQHVTKNIEEFMVQKLGIEESKVPELCVSLYKYYGTTLAGLRAVGYKLDYDDYSFVHGRLPYDILKPDLALKNLLHSVPVRKVVFTNADKRHAGKVLSRLGAAPNAGIALPKSPVVCKPFETAFDQVFKIANINPQRTLFFDDSIRNLQTGKRLGLNTVWVSRLSHRAEGVDCALESIHYIKEALPELWEASEKTEGVRTTYTAVLCACSVVIMEGDPHPGAAMGRMSFQSFNPSVDKLNEEAANFCRPEASDVHATGSSGQSRTSFRENGSSHDEAGCSDASKAKSDTDLKRKQSEVVAESQNQNKSPKTEGGQQLSPNSSKASFKQPKREKLDWSVLRPKSQSNQKKRG